MIDAQSPSSPVGGAALLRADGVAISQRPPPQTIELQTWDEASFLPRVRAALGVLLPTDPCAIVRQGSLRAFAAAPGRWLLLSDADWPFEADTLALSESGALTDLTGAHERMLVEGPAAARLLARGWALDLAAFAGDRGAQTTLWRVPTIVFAAPEGFEVLVERSYARFVWDHLGAALQRMRF